MGGRRRNRQPDANAREASDDSSESGDKENSGDNCHTPGKKSCVHVTTTLIKLKLSLKLRKIALETECEDCKKLDCNDTSIDGEETTPADLWMCLYCGHQACGRAQRSHALEHYKFGTEGNHCVVANTQSWSLWCYQCDREITSPHSRKLLDFIEASRKSNRLSSPGSHKKNSKKGANSPVSQSPIPLPFVRTELGNENVERSKISLNTLTRVVGLTNLGNTCFFNAVLQCLAQTPFLVKVLEDLQEPGEKFVLPGGKCKVTENSEEMELEPIEGTLEGWGAFTSILCKTLKAMQSMETRQVYVPNELFSSFKKKTMQCMDGGQHDSHELLRHLLELVRNEDLRRYQTVILKQIGIGVSIKVNCANDEHKAHVKFYGRQASSRFLGSELVFRGVLVSTLKCCECNHSSQRTEPFLDLSLPVMSEEPQSPFVKRKHKSFDDTYDSMGNNVSSASSMRNQFRKEEKRVEESKKQIKARLKDRGNNHGSKSNANRISEEKQSSTLESEGDADVEDNVPAPETIESSYSWDKASASTSLLSPTDEAPSKNSFDRFDANVSSTNGNVESSPVDDYATDYTRNDCDDNNTNGELNRQNCVDVTLNLNQTIMESPGASWMESPMNGTTNESAEYIGVSPCTSLIVNAESSPEGATMSSLSSLITPKDSPLSPPSSAVDEKLDIDKTYCSNIEPQSPEWDQYGERSDENLQAAVNGTSLSNTNSMLIPADREKYLDGRAAPESPECDSPSENKEDESPASPIDRLETRLENGVADITEKLCKVAVSTRRHSYGYHIKEGECSIQSCLNQFTSLELITGSNKVCCEACTARENKGKEGTKKMVCTPSTKQYLISQVPAVLILHLKRFQSLRMGFRKLAKHVKFPLLLDLAPVSVGGEKPKLYSLYGVVEHSGTLHGGHYVAYVKTRAPVAPDDPRWAFLPSKDKPEMAESRSSTNSDSETDDARTNDNVQPPPGHWYHISDSRVMEVDEATVLRTQAYILFYERIL